VCQALISLESASVGNRIPLEILELLLDESSHSFDSARRIGLFSSIDIVRCTDCVGNEGQFAPLPPKVDVRDRRS